MRKSKQPIGLFTGQNGLLGGFVMAIEGPAVGPSNQIKYRVALNDPEAGGRVEVPNVVPSNPRRDPALMDIVAAPVGTPVFIYKIAGRYYFIVYELDAVAECAQT